MSISIKKEYMLLTLVMFSAIFVVFKTYKHTPKLTIKAVVSSQNGALHSVYQERSVKESKIFYIDTLAFASGRVLSHSLYGKTSFSNNFFIDASSEFETTNKQKFYFDVYSDDGFVLKIDDKKVCEFVGDRAYKKSSCSVDLSKSKHNLNLSYFQGGGPLGLTLFYRAHQDKKWRTYGDDSDYLITKPLVLQ